MEIVLGSIKLFLNGKVYPKRGMNHSLKWVIPKTGKHSPKQGIKPSPKWVIALPQKGETQKTLTKNRKDNKYKPPQTLPLVKTKSFDPSSADLPTWLPKPIWDSWVQYRKEINKPIKSQMTVIQAIKLLGKCRENGHQAEEIINASIANGWQGLFEPQQLARTQQAKHQFVADNFSTKDYGTTQIPDWARDCL